MARHIFIASLLLGFLVRCGGSDEFSFTFVSDFGVSPGSAAVGGQATVLVVFESSTRSVFDETTGVADTQLAVVIPRGVDYVANSSELSAKPRSPNLSSQCDNGSRSLLYRFGSSELSSDGKNQVSLKVRPTEDRGTVTFLAEADSFISNPCSIPGQQSGTLVITP